MDSSDSGSDIAALNQREIRLRLRARVRARRTGHFWLRRHLWDCNAVRLGWWLTYPNRPHGLPTLWFCLLFWPLRWLIVANVRQPAFQLCGQICVDRKSVG